MRLTTAQMDRACGVLLGAAAGDALGAGYEFGSASLGDGPPRMIGGGLGGFAPGEWTDDTSMTFAIAEVAARGLDLRSVEGLDAVARSFRAWYDDGPADIGVQTRQVLSAAGPEPTAEVMTKAAAALHERTGRTGGNGSLMRTSPVALAYLDDPDAVAEAAHKVSALTHPDRRALEACVLWSLAIRHAVVTGEIDPYAGLGWLRFDSMLWWKGELKAAETLPPSTYAPNGYVVNALLAAWAAIAQTPEPGVGQPFGHLVAALEAAVRVGDDTDTVASIAGALLGAKWGASAVPAAWRRILHGWPGDTSRGLEKLALLIVNGGSPGKYGWPTVDHIDYRRHQWGEPALARHPHDPGVWMSGALALDDVPADVDAVVSLCLTGRRQVPDGLEQVTFRLVDEPWAAENPNLDFVLEDAARTVATLRAEGKVVLVHCVAAHSRTPTVAIAYSMLHLGVPLERAMADVCGALPAACPNHGFRTALRRLAGDALRRRDVAGRVEVD